METLFLILAGLLVSMVWAFFISPWLDKRPRNGGFVKPEIYSNKTEESTNAKCDIRGQV
jgi:hypothetical protein